jgi:protein-L-isoaspartate(D-aspartate) O-methyltransferase
MMKPKWQKLNHKLIDALKQQQVIVTDTVEDAFRQTPRHTFANEDNLNEAYANRVVSVVRDADGTAISSLSQPAMIAIMLEQLDLQPGHTVLEVGAGTGYNAALMASIVGDTGHVTTVDIDPAIVETAQGNLDTAEVENVTVLTADGAQGYPPHAPYDRVILTTSAGDIAPAWVVQLNAGGRLLLPLILTPRAQYAIAFDRTARGLRSDSHRACRFLTLRGALQAPPARRYRLDDGLTLDDAIIPPPHPLDRIRQWLNTDPTPHRTGVAATLDDVLYGVSFWLAMHAPQLYTLVQDDIQPRYFPPLLRQGNERAYFTAPLVCGDGGMALLTRKPPPHDNAPGELIVLQYGEAGAASYLRGLVEDWAQANKPDESQARFWAFPAGTTVTVEPPAVQLPRNNTLLVVTWR